MRMYLKMRYRLAWWWPAYCYGVAIVAIVTGRQPDLNKVRTWARRAIKFEVLGVDASE